MHVQILKNLGVRINEKCIEYDIYNQKSQNCGTLQNKAVVSKNDNSAEKTSFIEATYKNMPLNTQTTLKFPSVGATENFLLCFAFSPLKIELCNSAKEPEIVALQDFLNGLGANITGAGSSRIHISPTSCLDTGTALNKHYVFTTPYDRIEAGSYLLAGAVCGGKLYFEENSLITQQSLLNIIKPSIEKIEYKKSTSIKFRKFAYVSDLIVTSPYPGFPTDLQSPLSAYFCTVVGKNYIIESIFNNRAAHINELKKMGAKISRQKNCFIFYGRGHSSLHGTEVISKDLRGGFSLILSALSADGTTLISDNSNISRGYSNIEKKLSAIGANITKELL